MTKTNDEEIQELKRKIAFGTATEEEQARYDAAFPGQRSKPKSYWLGIVGFLLWASGLGILFLDPGGTLLGVPSDPGPFGTMVNLHALAVGMTLSINGAIFMAAQWRP